MRRSRDEFRGVGRRDDRWLLLWAALIGLCGAVVTVVFHEGMTFTESVATGHPGSLVSAAEALAPSRRAITPAIGGIAAGAILWWAQRLAGGKKESDYIEAIAVGDGRQGVRGTLMRSASSLITIASGGSIGREGAIGYLEMGKDAARQEGGFPSPTRQAVPMSIV